MQENEEKEEINMDIDLSYLDEPNDSVKTVVDKLVYMVDVTDPKRPYYSILYHPINSPNEYEGFGSYNQFYVKEWKEKYFIVKKKGDTKC